MARARDLGDAIGAGGVGAGGQHRLGTEGVRGADDALIVGGDQHLKRPRRAGTLIHPLQHRLAADRAQHLARQPRRGETCWYDHPEHARPLYL